MEMIDDQSDGVGKDDGEIGASDTTCPSIYKFG